MQLTAEIDPKKTYRLLQLTPDLEKSLKNGKLDLKSGTDGSVYACTETSTHLVRVLKQTNTLLLSLITDEQALSTYASPANLLETVTVPGVVDWTQVPEYKGTKYLNENSGSPQAEICCSQAEFKAQCRDKPATSINGILYYLSLDVTYNNLVNIVSSMVEAGDLELKTPFQSLKLEEYTDPKEVVEAVYKKFQKQDGTDCLDVDSITHFTGLYLLSKHPEGISTTAFVKEWRLDLPIPMKTVVASLYGHLVEINKDSSISSMVKPLDPASLPSDAKLRFHRLFSIKPEWPIAEIEPFIRELVPHVQKLDSWVLKYARKKRVNSDIYLIPLRRQGPPGR